MAVSAVLPIHVKARRLPQRARKAFLRALQPAKPVLSNLASIPLTVLGLGAVDTGVFVASPVAGWIVTGASLIVLEHLIADER